MKALGIILAGGSNTRMDILSKKRAIAAMPVGGSYRAIDFALSNMRNSNIQKVAVLTQYNARSLNEHLNSSKWWDFGRKQGGLYVLTPTLTEENGFWYRGTADAIWQNIDFLKHSHEPYVIIASGDCIYKMDYNDVLDYHIEKKADITVVCKDLPKDDPELNRYGIVKMDEDGRITEFEEKPLMADSSTVSAGIYIMRRRQLIEMLEKSAEENRFDLVKDILIRYKDQKQIYGYKMDGYWSNISTLDSYYRTNMDFLCPEVGKVFFKDSPHIYTKQEDLAPAKYNTGSSVKNCLVSSGCIINGSVEHSILYRQVFIGKNCQIRNSVILNDVYIGDNSIVENCIVESRSTLKADSVFRGGDGVKVVYEKNERYQV